MQYEGAEQGSGFKVDIGSFQDSSPNFHVASKWKEGTEDVPQVTTLLYKGPIKKSF